MRHWSQLATRNWRARPLRTLGAVLAIALGTASVVWVTCCYESVRRTVMDWAVGYIGNSHVTISSPVGRFGQLPERLVADVLRVPNVETACPTLLQRSRYLLCPRDRLDDPGLPQRWRAETPEVDLIGIDLASEYKVRDHQAILREGRLLRPEDRLACTIELAVARDGGVGVGDYLLIWTDTQEAPVPIEIVGLFDRRRIARFQKSLAYLPLATLQELRGKTALITSIDVVLARHDRNEVRASAERIRAKVRSGGHNATVRSAEARMKQVEQAQDQQRFVLVLLSCVAMLTALFIILSTLSMGMIERIGQLGLMRCIGLTRGQLAALVLVEVMPLGAAGVIVGVPIGLALTALTVVLVPDYVGSFAVSLSGIGMAAGAGMLTTLLAGLIPAAATLRVSPMEAARPRARHERGYWLVVAACLAALVFVVQHFLVVNQAGRSVWFPQVASLGVILLYVGYALVAAPAVRAIGTFTVYVAARVLRVRTRLLQDQVGHAVWRSAGICCGLMVGLSLIVGIVVVNESVTKGWQFPTKFPEAYIWNPEFIRLPDLHDRVARTPGVRNFATTTIANVIVDEEPSALGQFLMSQKFLVSFTWFMGCDPDEFFDLVKLEFVEGDPEVARENLKKGGYILVADDFSRSRNKHLGDEVKIWYGAPMKSFKVAGVILSPALDIAAGYFQAHTEYNVVASGSVLGTNDDLRKYFRIDGASAVLFNFDLPPEPVPPAWPPPRDSADARAAGLGEEFYDTRLSLERRWQKYRESRVLADLRQRLEVPNANGGTVRELKDEIDREITRMTRLMTAVPSVALLVAAIGVANLMLANVTSRARQLAILRAVGATRGLVLRMIIGEAVVLGAIGSALGLALGIHFAANVTELVNRMWGFRVDLQLPWELIGGAILLTVGLCVIAGIFPARHAARTNIVDALHVA